MFHISKSTYESLAIAILLREITNTDILRSISTVKLSYGPHQYEWLPFSPVYLLGDKIDM